jgi:hypothetical protein
MWEAEAFCSCTKGEADEGEERAEILEPPVSPDGMKGGGERDR